MRLSAKGSPRLGGTVALVLLLLATAAPAHAQVQPYGTNDGGGFRNILPPGQTGFNNAAQLGGFVAAGARVRHSDDQLRMYENLVYATPGLTQERLPEFFKDASFGIKPGDVERQYSPRPDVTVQRDRAFGVPRVYGATRSGTMFGAGYASSEDRLFFMDVLRNAGRAKLSSFAGGSKGNRKTDQDVWSLAPYTEAELQRQYDRLDDLYGADGRQVQKDVADYTEGVNAYIRAAKANPLLMPGEYPALGKPEGPAPWKVTDLISVGTLVGSIFGKGGGRELDSALALQASQRRFGRRAGLGAWRDFRAAEDPEAPVTVLDNKRFPYQRPPRRVRSGSTAMPDSGSVEKSKYVTSTTAPRSTGRSAVESVLGGIRSLPRSMSNALLVSARESQSGRPIAVFGPQVGYFNPQILQEIELHGPGIDARGAAFNGAALYVTLGRGRDYAWSPTSSSQDIIDTFALDLCEPGGGRPTQRSTHYRYRGRCLPFEVLDRTNSFKPNLADSTPAGSETLRTRRSKMGLVVATGRVRGRPVAYTSLRTTYNHEIDAAVGLRLYNDPGAIRSARDFQRAAMQLHYTFHWFYIDDKDIAFINTGDQPVRARGVDQNLPVSARFPWRNYNAEENTASYVPFRERAQAINQRYIVNWNNKGARAFRAADSNWEYSPIYRSQLLEGRVTAGIRGPRKMSLPNLVDAMETAGTTDLRGDKVLPYILRALGTPSDPKLRAAVETLRAWGRAGYQRKDADRDGVYDNEDAVRIMDAWWPLLVKQALEPSLGEDVYRRFLDFKRLDNEPNNHGDHLGSAYQGGTYGLIQKDLRTLMGSRRLTGLRHSPRRAARFSRRYCGSDRTHRATLSRCRALLASTLAEALTKTPAELYGKDPICDKQPGIGPKDPRRRSANVFCFDAIRFRPAGAVEQPLIHWVNRPTFQQAVEIRSRVPR